MLREGRKFRSISVAPARRHNWTRRNTACGMPELCGISGLTANYSPTTVATLENQPKQGLLAGLKQSDRFEIKT
jgi:hypothetical protein